MQCFYAGDFTLFAAVPGGRLIRPRPIPDSFEVKSRGGGAVLATTRRRGSAGGVAGNNLTEIEGMVIFFGIELFQLRVEKGIVHR